MIVWTQQKINKGIFVEQVIAEGRRIGKDSFGVWPLVRLCCCTAAALSANITYGTGKVSFFVSLRDVMRLHMAWKSEISCNHLGDVILYFFSPFYYQNSLNSVFVERLLATSSNQRIFWNFVRLAESLYRILFWKFVKANAYFRINILIILKSLFIFKFLCI